MENTSPRDTMSSETFIGPSAAGLGGTGPIVGLSLADCNGYAVRAPARRCLLTSFRPPPHENAAAHPNPQRKSATSRPSPQISRCFLTLSDKPFPDSRRPDRTSSLFLPAGRA